MRDRTLSRKGVQSLGNQTKVLLDVAKKKGRSHGHTVRQAD